VDLSCIISSGDLELYVLDSLSPEETYQVEQLMSIFPEVREEVDRISETVERMALQSTHAPGENTRANVFASFKRLKAEEDPQAPSKIIATQNPPVTTSYTTIRRINGYRYMAVAAVFLLVVSIGLLMLVTNQNSKKNKLIGTLNQQVAAVSNKARQQSGDYEQLMNLLKNKDYQQIKLQPLPGKPEATANIYWNQKTSDVYLLDISLPAAPANRQYQLWAIVDGKPVSAGMLSGSHTTEKMGRFANAQAFAITLEKAGGSETPTLDQMYVMGKT
jgi:anti-sigma-K factor RskA